MSNCFGNKFFLNSNFNVNFKDVTGTMVDNQTQTGTQTKNQILSFECVFFRPLGSGLTARP